MSNAHLALRFWRTDRCMDHLVRNSDGDEIVFVHEGGGELYCDYGHLTLRDGDYVMLPRGTAWRIETDAPFAALLLEATNDGYGLPDKGIAGQHAVFDAAALDVPAIDDAFRAQQRDGAWRIVIKRRNALSTQAFDFNPLDAVGWHGTLMPVRLNWRSIRPLMSHRAHLPPSAHTTFASNRFVVCTFCPRPLESDPGALRVPFFHNNDDYDEVIFYHAGEFFSRDSIHPGMITLHPSGFTHGPHPKAFQAGARAARSETNEVAVMIDARDALDVAPLPEGVEWTGYVDSWKTPANQQDLAKVK
jgi:homogentisate 1,2-dioxygenase